MRKEEDMAESRLTEKSVKVQDMKEVEKLRALLCDLVEEQGTKNDAVIAVSSMLDMAILEIMTLKHNS